MRSEGHGKTRETESGQAFPRGLEKSLSTKFCEEIMKLHGDLCHRAKQMLRRTRQKLELGALDVEFQELNLSKAVSVHQSGERDSSDLYGFAVFVFVRWNDPTGLQALPKEKRVVPSVAARAAFTTSVEP